jgi:hypothetical protein
MTTTNHPKNTNTPSSNNENSSNSTNHVHGDVALNEDAAVLYQSSNNIQQGCGHVIGWKTWLEIIQSSDAPIACPVCQASVGMVMDGKVATNTDSNNNNNNNMVYFKYGKQIYQLSTSVCRHNNAPQKNSTGGFLSAAGKRSSAPSQDDTLLLLAQDRIVQALQFVDRSTLKILHQGKVLYPPPMAKSSSTKSQDDGGDDSTTTITESIISRRLVEISHADLSHKGHGALNKKKTSLVVMGTRHDGLQQIHQHRHDANKKTNTSWWWQTIILLWRLPWQIFSVSLQVSWLLVGSMVLPFLPPSWVERFNKMLGNNNNNNNSDNNNSSSSDSTNSNESHQHNE